MTIYIIILLTLIMVTLTYNLFDYGLHELTNSNNNLYEGIAGIKQCSGGQSLYNNVCIGEWQGPKPNGIGNEIPKKPICGEAVASCPGWTCSKDQNLKYCPPGVAGASSEGYCCVNGTWLSGKCSPYCEGGARSITGRSSNGSGACTRQFPFSAYGGKICYNKKSYADINKGPCSSWCTNDATVSVDATCGNASNKMCYPVGVTTADNGIKSGVVAPSKTSNARTPISDIGDPRGPDANAYCSATNTNKNLWCPQKSCLLPGFTGDPMGRLPCPTPQTVGDITIPPLPQVSAMVPILISGIQNALSLQPS